MTKKKSEISGDALGEETTQVVEPEITSEVEVPEPEETLTLTQKELGDRINAGRAELGRTLKTTLESHSVLQRNYDGQGKRLSELENTLRSIKQRERERELKEAEGMPDLLDKVRREHQADDKIEEADRRISEADAREAQYQARIDKVLETEAKELAKELAESSGLTATLLIQIASDVSQDGRTTYNLERMKQIAKSTPKGESEEEETEEGAGKEPAVRGQQTRAAGAGGRTATRGFRTFGDYEEAFIHGDLSYEQYQEAAKRFNKNI